MPLSRYKSQFYPADLAILQKVFDSVSKARGIAPDGDDAVALAVAIVGLRKSGLDEEEELIAVLSRRSRPKKR